MYYLLLTLYFISFGLMAYTVVSILWPQRSALTEQIGFYEQSWQAAHVAPGNETKEIIGTGPADRLKLAWARVLGSRESVNYLKGRLEKSGRDIEWSEFAFYHLLSVIIAGALTSWLFGWVAAVVVILFAAWSAGAFLNLLVSMRQSAFSNQLPETLTMLSGSLKAGYSLLQAVDMVSKETTAPMAEEFNRVLTDARLGLPVEEALDKMAARVENTNFEWMIMAIKIQREVGGNLVEVLTTLANTIRERETVARQIKVLTAEGRLSAIILLALPVFVSVAQYILNPSYMTKLFDNTSGLALLASALFLMSIGALWLRKIVKIEV